MAFDTFLEIEGLPGECLDSKHKNWIQLFSFSHQVTQVGDASASALGARTAGKCDHGDFHFTKTMDKCTPFLLNKCCTGKHYPKAVVEICKNTGEKRVFMKYIMEHVVVSGISTGGGQGQEAPMESVSFSYSKIKWEYTPLDPGTGTPQAKAAAEWNIQTGEGR
jgi:type VI secretion system secreted protein Hcp